MAFRSVARVRLCRPGSTHWVRRACSPDHSGNDPSRKRKEQRPAWRLAFFVLNWGLHPLRVKALIKALHMHLLLPYFETLLHSCSLVDLGNIDSSVTLIVSQREAPQK